MYLGLRARFPRSSEWDGGGELLQVSPSVVPSWGRALVGLSQTPVPETCGVCSGPPSFRHTYSWNQQPRSTESHLVLWG